MIPQVVLTANRPLAVGTVSRGMRWGALALASVAVPLALVVAGLGVTSPTALPAGEVVEARAAGLDVPRPEVLAPSGPTLPALPPADDAVLPSYFGFAWPEECAKECAGRSV